MPPVVNGFADRLPDSAQQRIVGVANANLPWKEPAAGADRLENALNEAWRRDAYKRDDGAIEAASQGGKSTAPASR